MNNLTMHFLLPAIVLAAIPLYYYFFDDSIILELKNNSQETIQEIKIELCSQQKALHSFPPQGHELMKFSNPSDCSYEVQAIFTSGKLLKQTNLGYVTHGMKSHHIMIFSADQIQLKEK